MDMTTPADLLAMIPTVVEREPEEMLVLVTMKDGRVQAVMGLEHCEDESMVPEYITAIIEQMSEIKPDAMVAVFYTESESECEHDPYEHVNILLMAVIGLLTPMDVAPGLLVKGGKYKIYGTSHWHDLSEVKDSTLAAQLVLNGVPLEPQGVVVPEPTAVTPDIIDAIDDAVMCVPEFPERLRDVWAMPYVAEERALWGELLMRGFGATEDEAIRMVAAFQVPALRDRLMVDTVSTTTNMIDFGVTITGNSHEPVHRERLEEAGKLLDNLMQWTCDRHRAPLLVAQAWLHWMQGRSLDADNYLDAALAADPDYTLARAFHRYITEIKRVPDKVMEDPSL